MDNLFETGEWRIGKVYDWNKNDGKQRWMEGEPLENGKKISKQ